MTKQSILVLFALLILVSACSSLPGDEPGSIVMGPFSLPEMAIEGMVPSACQRVASGVFGCEALAPGESLVAVVLSAHALPLAQLEEALADSLGVAALPPAVGVYQGKALTWQRYQVVSELKDQGLPPSEEGLYQVDLALSESGGRFLLVALITVPGDREAHAAFYDALFEHVLYTLIPLPSADALQQEGS